MCGRQYNKFRQCISYSDTISYSDSDGEPYLFTDSGSSDIKMDENAVSSVI